MTDATADAEEAPPKRGKMPLVIGLVLGLAGAGAGYFLMAGGSEKETAKVEKTSDDIAFVPIQSMTIPIGTAENARYLRFSAQLEVSPSYADEVEKKMPRVVDVLNTYLRSVTLAELEDPSALLTLRAQMRRRIDLVVGGELVRDLLVMEFVVS
ncbi:flagellar basal body protein FliL [Alphaproteobacteria bacterium GH1-50]|uniref:Flagellar protein FliL n=1 Tax=Kangsaoukella pontilimi TaxID=2691042 RepID=A0A7C9II58_9RHOB|nr:flagellar basal body-associated FliL family protein [Kangsaoukella pontilimi]MXQ08162.1 flagellar basal body protein FliL [Kangsaoukella pontilimi]